MISYWKHQACIIIGVHHKGMGMIGLIVVGGDTSNKAAIAKAKAFGKSKKKLASMLAKL